MKKILILMLMLFIGTSTFGQTDSPFNQNIKQKVSEVQSALQKSFYQGTWFKDGKNGEAWSHMVTKAYNKNKNILQYVLTIKYGPNGVTEVEMSDYKRGAKMKSIDIAKHEKLSKWMRDQKSKLMAVLKKENLLAPNNTLASLDKQ